jgi:hypothetical protein
MQELEARVNNMDPTQLRNQFYEPYKALENLFEGKAVSPDEMLKQIDIVLVGYYASTTI